MPNDLDSTRTQAYRKLEKWIAGGICTPVWCEILAAEWIRDKELNRTRDYARILDASPQILEFDPGVIGVPLAECLNECKRVEPTLCFSKFKILHPLQFKNPLLRFVSMHHPASSASENTIPVFSSSSMPLRPTVKIIVDTYRVCKAKNPEQWEVGIEGDQIAFETTKATQSRVTPERIFDESTVKYWILNAMQLQEILRSVDANCDPQSIIDKIELKNCPGTSLFYRTYDKYVRGKSQYDDSHDMIDQATIAGLAYCDYALVDKRVRDYLEQAQRSGVGEGLQAEHDVRIVISSITIM